MGLPNNRTNKGPQQPSLFPIKDDEADLGPGAKIIPLTVKNPVASRQIPFNESSVVRQLIRDGEIDETEIENLYKKTGHNDIYHQDD